MPDDRILAGLRFQRLGFDQAALDSPLYAAVLDAVIADYEAGGPCAAVLDRTPAGLDPVADAVTLRFLGALHRIVLTGRAPELARWFPTAGGAFTPGEGDPGPDALAAVEAHRDELVDGLSQPVQTNEVGRCAALAVGLTAVLRRFGLPLRLLEVGSSAGLNLRWDAWRYEPGPTAWGDESAALRFGDDVYRDPRPDVSAPLGPGDAVAARHGCDRSPIDPTTTEGRLLLRSFVWPDQSERLARLDAALAVAAEIPATVEAADAAAWLAVQLAEPVPATATVVFHSIVWQYLPQATKDGVVAALASAGAAASPRAPLAWLRMEPPGERYDKAAAVTLTVWSGAGPEDRVVARSGYHGRPVRAVA